MEYHFQTPVVNRLPIRLDYGKDITMYGSDNLYPQRQEQVRLASPLIKSATDIYADFINGSGWELNNKVVLNDQGETSRDLLNLVAMDYSKYGGFALHCNFNGLGKITEVQHIPFEFVRLGLPNEFGQVNRVWVSNNWEEDGEKLPVGKKFERQWYPLFNPLAAQADTVIPQPKGQVLYYTGIEKWKYPLTTFDAITDTAKTDYAIQRYEKNNTEKGFHGATIFKYPGKFEGEKQKYQVLDQVSKMMGPDGPGVTVAEVDEDFTGELMESIPSNSDDALFGRTTDNILNRCLQHYNIPPALFGVAPTGGVFTQLAYQESFIVYNVLTRNKRDEVARVFNKIAQLWWQQAFLFGKIKENEFAVQSEINKPIFNRQTGPTDQQLDVENKDKAKRILSPNKGGEFGN